MRATAAQLETAHVRPVTRIQAAAIASGMPPVEDAAGETWMMTYLDMMTLLLVVTMAMLALAGKGHERTRHGAEVSGPPVFSFKRLASVEVPGALLLVPVVAPEPEPVAAPEPVAVVDQRSGWSSVAQSKSSSLLGSTRTTAAGWRTAGRRRGRGRPAGSA